MSSPDHSSSHPLNLHAVSHHVEHGDHGGHHGHGESMGAKEILGTGLEIAGVIASGMIGLLRSISGFVFGGEHGGGHGSKHGHGSELFDFGEFFASFVPEHGGGGGGKSHGGGGHH